jgi:hypothetical protein
VLARKRVSSGSVTCTSSMRRSAATADQPGTPGLSLQPMIHVARGGLDAIEAGLREARIAVARPTAACPGFGRQLQVTTPEGRPVHQDQPDPNLPVADCSPMSRQRRRVSDREPRTSR